MPDPIIVIEGKSILDLDDGVSPIGDEYMELVQNGLNVKLPLSVIRSDNGSILVANYLFSTLLTEVDPGAGFLRFNSASMAAVTEIYIADHTQSPITDISDRLSQLIENDAIRIQLGNDAENYFRFKLLDSAIDNGSWWSIPVEFIDGNGVLFTNNAAIVGIVIFNAGAGTGGQNASEVDRGVVEEATDAQVLAGTGDGETGARLFVSPPKLATRLAALVIVNASETQKGIVEEATQIQVNNGTGLGETGARLFVSPDKLATRLSQTQFFVGYYLSLAALTVANPDPIDGAYGYVDLGTGNAARIYLWDNNDSQWVAGSITEIANADETQKGIVEEATDVETQAGTSIGGSLAKLFVSPAKLLTWFASLVSAGTFIPANASETAKGIVEEATDAETIAGTASGTLAKLFITPAKNATWWTWAKTQVQTFIAKITFTAAPRFESTTADQFLKVDATKDLISVPPASNSDLITGTDNTKPLTASALAGYRSLAEIAAVVSGGVLNLNFGTQVEAVFNVATTIAANCTLTVTSTNGKSFLLQFDVTGTITITMPSSFIFESGEVALGRWNAATKVLTLTGATSTYFEIVGFRRGSFWKCISSKYS